MKNIDMSTLSPEVAAYIRSLEETVLEQKMELVRQKGQRPVLCVSA